MTRLESILEVVSPVYEWIFVDFTKKTSLVLLRQHSGSEAPLAAQKRKVVKLLRETNHGHLGETRYQELIAAAQTTLALPGAQGALAEKIPLIIERIEMFSVQLATLESRMIAVCELSKFCRTRAVIMSSPRLPLRLGSPLL